MQHSHSGAEENSEVNFVEQTDEDGDSTIHQFTTLKEVQEDLIQRHPFGIKIWKPALYRKHRSIDEQTYKDLHTIPGSIQHEFSLGNISWLVLFGWWIALVYVLLALVLSLLYGLGLLFSCRPLVKLKDYISLLLNLSGYILWPFGKFIAKKESDFNSLMPLPSASMPLMSDQDHSNINLQGQTNVSDDERDDLPSQRHPDWKSDFGDSESELGGTNLYLSLKRAWKSGVSGLIFFFCCVLVLAPIHLLTSAIMFFLVLPIPMAKLNYYLLRHILRHPLDLSAHWCEEGTGVTITPQTGTSPARPRSVFFWSSDSANAFLGTSPNPNHLPQIMATPSLHPLMGQNGFEYQIVLCTYKAMGLKYAKFTVDGVNIILINLLSMIFFTIFDAYVLGPRYGNTGIASKPVIFISGIISTIPLSYFIGMAVSSITAQTGSVAVGSVVNATFGSIIEILLYAFGLMEGKEELVQGAMIGSFLLGLLALPGVSMFFGGLHRAEQRFNAKSASVTSTMLVVAIICVFTPTVFQNIHGSYEYICKSCPGEKDCRTCKIYQPHPTEDKIYLAATRPLMYICAIALIVTYAVGLWFTLRTHSKRIYGKKSSKKKTQMPSSLRRMDSIDAHNARLGKVSERPVSYPGRSNTTEFHGSVAGPSSSSYGSVKSRSKYSESRSPRRKAAARSSEDDHVHAVRMPNSPPTVPESAYSFSSSDEGGDEENDGHDNPGWSIFKSAIILLGCTVAYSMIAEILIGAVDEMIQVFPVSEKILGLTLFAIVPTVTEFYNAISFAVNGNIVLALEIGSAYAIQVALLQIPVLVGFSAWWNAHPRNKTPGLGHSRSQFTLVFPQWEFYCLVFSVFLLTYIYLEGKSNYFKGALLLVTYFVLISAFFFEPIPLL